MRSERLVWQVDQFSNDRLIEIESHLLLCRKVPTAHGIRQLLKLLNKLTSGYVVSTSIRQRFERYLHRLQHISPAQHQSR